MIWPVTVYNAFLILFVGVLAIRTRRIRENYGEATFIGFAILATIPIWVCWILATCVLQVSSFNPHFKLCWDPLWERIMILVNVYIGQATRRMRGFWLSSSEFIHIPHHFYAKGKSCPSNLFQLAGIPTVTKIIKGLIMHNMLSFRDVNWQQWPVVGNS